GYPADARRGQPVDRQEGPVLAAAAAGVGDRGRVRRDGGRPLPTYRTVQAFPPGPDPRVVYLRPARPAGTVQRRRGPRGLTPGSYARTPTRQPAGQRGGTSCAPSYRFRDRRAPGAAVERLHGADRALGLAHL